MTCRPPVEPQLVKGIPTAGEDCGVRTVMRAIRWSSCKKVAITVAETRQFLGKPTGATNPGDWAKALEHPTLIARFKAAGLQAPVFHLRGVNPTTGIINGSVIATAIAALQAGDLVCVAEGYGPWHGTKFAGSATFVDNHAVSYLGLKGAVGGNRRTTRYDSLDDGRFAGIPTGPLTVPFHLVVDAMGALTFKSGRKLGHGLWAGMVVEKAQPLVHTPPPPPPADCATELAAAQAQVDALTNGLEDARQAITDLHARFAAVDQDAQDADADAAAALAAIAALLGDTPETADPSATVVSGTDTNE